jgi:hypothetical protein
MGNTSPAAWYMPSMAIPQQGSQGANLFEGSDDDSIGTIDELPTGDFYNEFDGCGDNLALPTTIWYVSL